MAVIDVSPRTSSRYNAPTFQGLAEAGRAWGNAFQNVGNAWGDAFKERRKKQAEEAVNSLFSDAMANYQTTGEIGDLSGLDPQLQQAIFGAQARDREAAQRQANADRQFGLQQDQFDYRKAQDAATPTAPVKPPTMNS